MDAHRSNVFVTTALLVAAAPGLARAQDAPAAPSPTERRQADHERSYLTLPWLTRVAQAPAPAAAPVQPPTPAPAPTPATPPAQPPTPAPTTPAAPGGLAAATPTPTPTPTPAAALDSTLGLLELGESPIMLGDVGPSSTLRSFALPGLGPPPAPVPPVPPGAPLPGGLLRPGQLVRVVIPSVGGFKVADNQSPRPQDRVYATFNYFGDINGSVNRHFGGYIESMHIYRETFGFEKTFWDRNASIGLRAPIDTLSVTTPIRSLGGTSTSVGSLSVNGKYVLWQDAARKNLISTCLMFTAPTGPSSFAGAPASRGFRDLSIQPCVSFFYSEGRFYAQGFSAINIVTDPRDVTSYFNDVGMGYFLYRAASKTSTVQAFAPTFEAHINTPLNHRGALRISDPSGVPDVVNLTYGASMVFKQGAILSVGVATPVTGPRPFAYEVLAVLNWYFGPTRKAGFPATTPPLF